MQQFPKLGQTNLYLLPMLLSALGKQTLIQAQDNNLKQDKLLRHRCSLQSSLQSLLEDVFGADSDDEGPSTQHQKASAPARQASSMPQCKMHPVLDPTFRKYS